MCSAQKFSIQIKGDGFLLFYRGHIKHVALPLLLLLLLILGLRDTVVLQPRVSLFFPVVLQPGGPPCAQLLLCLI